MQICQIGTADIKHLHSKDIRMVMLAEGGAMGEPGVVVIVEKQKSGVRVSHANYCYGDFDMDKFAKVFTPLQTLDCGLFGRATGIAPGWHHVDLGPEITCWFVMPFTKNLRHAQKKCLRLKFTRATWKSVRRF